MKLPFSRLTKNLLLLALTTLFTTISAEEVHAGTGTFKDGKFNFCVSVRFNATQAQLDAIKVRFERASQILADATDGQHQFGKIAIINNSEASDEAEFWIFPGAGRANAQTYGVRRAHVVMYMASNFSKVGDDNAFTIVHEFGHHAYDLGDEYASKIFPDGSEIQARCPGPDVNDPNLTYCIMDNVNRGTRKTSTSFSVTEFCVASNHDKPDAQGREGFDTLQHQEHGESCWETMSHLIKPWRLKPPNGLPQNAPPTTQPVVFVPTCTSQIQRTMLLVDRSGSMSDTANPVHGSRLMIAQRGLNHFIDMYNAGNVSGNFVGLASFSTSARVDAPIAEMNSDAVRSGLKTAVGTLAPDGATNIGEGLLVAKEQLDAQGACDDCHKTIVLISDGDHNLGVPPESVIAELQASGIKVITVALGSTISVTGEVALKNLSTQTGGAYNRSVGDNQIITFLRNLALDSGGFLPGVEVPSTIISSGGQKEFSSYVEAGSNNTTFSVGAPDPADNITISLVKPSGAVVTESGATGIEFIASSNVRTFRVTNPEAGTWKIVVKAGTIRTGELTVSSYIKHAGVNFYAWVENEGLMFPTDPVRLHAAPAYDGRGVVGGSVAGTATRPDGSKLPITLFDDGLAEHGDITGGDGIYSALFNQYNKDGTYSFDLSWQNVSGELYKGEPLPDENGNVIPVPSVSAPAFNRVTRTTAVVAGVAEGDLVWFDDAIPQGATAQGGWYWVNANPAPIQGGAAHQSKITSLSPSAIDEHSFVGASSKLPIGAGDKLFAYVFLDPNMAPDEIMLQWHTDDGWEHRAYWGTSYIQLGSEGTNSRRFMGPLPITGRWVRLEVDASVVGLEGKALDGMAFNTNGNRATWDRAGRLHGVTGQPPPADFVWFDDDLPAGAVPGATDDHWEWVTSAPAPFSGQRCNRSFLADKTDNGRLRQHFFTRAQSTMRVDPGDVLFTYVYLDPTFRPDEIIVQWNDGDGWEHRAYWGGNFVGVGVHGTESLRFMGGLPPAGQWVRLEVPASYVGLEGKVVSGMSFGYYRQNDRARASWDVSGKTMRATSVLLPLQSIVPLYRFRADSYGYSYSTNDIGRAEQVLQRVQGYVHANQAAGTVPFYRFRNADRYYFYSTAKTPAPGWFSDGIAFYIYPSQTPPPGTVPLHAFHNSKGFFYTTDQSEGFGIGYTYDGVSGYIHDTLLLVPVPPSNAYIPGQPLTMFWTDNSSNESGFKVEYLNAAGAWQEIGTVGANVTQFSSPEMNQCGAHFRVRAFNGSGFSPYSNVTDAGIPFGAGNCVYATPSGSNYPPSVSMTRPADGTTYKAGTRVQISADAFDPDGNGTIAKVEFFDGGLKIGAATQAPYSINWSGASTGAHSLTATVTDAGGLAATSAPVNISVLPLAAGDVIISEFRFRGGASHLDEFVELYNNTNYPITVASTDGTSGWSLVGSDGAVKFTIPRGTIIPARGHFLGVNNAYGLTAYARGDAAWDADIADGAGVALFSTFNTTNFNLGTRLDAVGFAGVTDSLFREGAGLQPAAGVSTNAEFSFYRKLNVGALPKDTGDNAADFAFVSTEGIAAGGVQSALGAPGPECLSSPIQSDSTFSVTMLDPAVSSSQVPNRVRDFTPDPVNNSPIGTMGIRRTVTNNTGSPITRLRFRVIDITTYPAAAGVVDFRLRSSLTSQVTRTDSSVVTLQGLTLEAPPAQPIGGGFNSTVSAGTITLAQPLQPGASVNVEFLLGLQQSGSFRFYISVEAWQ